MEANISFTRTNDVTGHVRPHPLLIGVNSFVLVSLIILLLSPRDNIILDSSKL